MAAFHDHLTSAVLDPDRQRRRRAPGPHRHRRRGHHRRGRRVLHHDPGADAGVAAVRPPHDAQLRPRHRQPGHAGRLRRHVRLLGAGARSPSPARSDFVPHLSTTVAEALLLVDIAVLIYFIHHIAKSIQLPEVIAGIARDLMRPSTPSSRAEVGGAARRRRATGKSVPELLHADRGERAVSFRTGQRLPAVRRIRPVGRHRRPYRRGHPP